MEEGQPCLAAGGDLAPTEVAGVGGLGHLSKHWGCGWWPSVEGDTEAEIMADL